MTFGDKIRELRKEKKMTQQKLGAMVGVSYRTIRSWEVEGRYPKQSSLYQKLADALQCRGSYLMNDNETVCLGNDESSEYSGAKLNRQGRFLNRQLLYLPVELWTMRTKLLSWMRWRDFIWHLKRTEENGKKKWTVLFSWLLEKKDRTYNSVNDPERVTLEIELFAPMVRV